MNDYRILVVDDEEDLCEILKFNLENEGYEVDTANSAEEALKMDICNYNLLLLDVMMGEISGFKMASMLKKDKENGPDTHHLHHRQRYGKRHGDRFQPGSGRLHIQTLLAARSGGTCQSRTETHPARRNGACTGTDFLQDAGAGHHQEKSLH